MGAPRFYRRTRTSAANDEAVQALRRIGHSSSILQIYGAGPTSTVVKIRTVPWAAVTDIVARFRSLHIHNDLGEEGRPWALRARSQAEIAGTSQQAGPFDAWPRSPRSGAPLACRRHGGRKHATNPRRKLSTSPATRRGKTRRRSFAERPPRPACGRGTGWSCECKDKTWSQT